MALVPPLVHAILIIAGWALSVTGVVIAMNPKGKNKLKKHMYLEIVGGSLMLVGAILGMFSTIIHAFIAMAAIILLGMGLGGGLYYQSLKPASDDKVTIEKKKTFRMMHINGGRLTNIVLLVVIALGIIVIFAMPT
jgi:hypothetical protein